MKRIVKSAALLAALCFGVNPAHAGGNRDCHRGPSCEASCEATCEATCAAGCHEEATCEASCGVDECDTSDDCCECDLEECEDCDSGCGCYWEAEATFFKYHRADGARVGDGTELDTEAPSDENAEFDEHLAPRITIGFVNSSGLGARVRWWDFDDQATAGESDESVLSVDTYTLDVEVFDTFQLTPDWLLEASAGFRYNEFREEMRDVFSGNPGDESLIEDRFNAFHGLGLVSGLKLTRTYGENGGVYFKARGAVLGGDKQVFNEFERSGGVGFTTTDEELADVTVGMIELGMGYEYRRELESGATFVLGSGVEFQNWFNFSSAFDDGSVGTPGGLTPEVFLAPEEQFGAPSDVGFMGLTATIGFTR